MKIQIISPSLRDERQSHNVALYLENWINNNTDADANVIDLKERNYPLFEERLGFQKEPHAGAVQFGKEISEANGVIIIAPEYNGSFPASLKNVIDLLYAEWQQKPVVLVPLSVGDMAGAQVAMQLEFVMYKIGARVAKARFHVANVSDNFNADGTSNNDEFFSEHAKSCFNEMQSLMK